MIEIINEALQWLLILLLFSSTGKLWKAVTIISARTWDIRRNIDL